MAVQPHRAASFSGYAWLTQALVAVVVAALLAAVMVVLLAPDRWAAEAGSGVPPAAQPREPAPGRAPWV